MRPINATDLMNPEVMAVQADMSLDDLAQFLIDNHISGAPVFDGPNQLVGVISLFDVVSALTTDEEGDEQAGDEQEADEQEADEQEADEPLTVRDVMTEEVISVTEDATVQEIATLILRRHLHRVVVMREEEVVGIISTSDLLGLLVDT